MTVQERFAQDWNMPLLAVQMLVEYARKCFRANVGYCNGDPHRNSDDKKDKNANAKEWQRDLGRLTDRLRILVEPYGFTDVAYTGLGPTLMRGTRYVDIPYGDK